MVRYIVGGVVALVVVLQLVSYIRYRRLDWPSSLSYYAYRRNTRRYMQRCGWTIDQRVFVSFDFWADRKGTRLAIVLLPPGMDLNSSKIKDLSGIMPEQIQGRSIVIVSHPAVPRHLVEEASRSKIRVIWYKDLGQL